MTFDISGAPPISSLPASLGGAEHSSGQPMAAESPERGAVHTAPERL